MAEPSGAAEPAAPPAPDPIGAADRGRLELRARAVERLAATAAHRTDGVRRWRTGLGRLAGRELPRVETTVRGGRVRATVEVAVGWGVALPETASAVQRNVSRALSEFGGLVVDGVDVHVGAVVTPDAPTAELAALTVGASGDGGTDAPA